MVCCEGLAGGSAYVNVFYRLGKGDEVDDEEGREEGLESGLQVKDRRRKEQEKEFVSFISSLSLSGRRS